MKTFVSFFLGVSLSGVLFVFYGNDTKVSSDNHLTWAQNGIKHISSQSDISKKIQEAERYYGKAVVLFLASLYHQQSKKILDCNENIKPNILNKNDTEFFDQTVPSKYEIPVVGAGQLKKGIAKQLSDEEKNIERMVNFRKAPLITSLTSGVRNLNGLFYGTFTHANGKNKGRVDQVEMDIFLEVQKKILSGMIKIQFTDQDGNIYSRSVNDGENAKLRVFKDDANKIYLEPSPGSFIILDISNSKFLHGDFYDSDGAYKGVVKIWKK